jgi:hypothetical protein
MAAQRKGGGLLRHFSDSAEPAELQALSGRGSRERSALFLSLSLSLTFTELPFQ